MIVDRIWFGYLHGEPHGEPENLTSNLILIVRYFGWNITDLKVAARNQLTASRTFDTERTHTRRKNYSIFLWFEAFCCSSLLIDWKTIRFFHRFWIKCMDVFLVQVRLKIPWQHFWFYCIFYIIFHRFWL